MAFKIVVADPKTGKSYKLETEEKSLLGLKIGEKFQGDALGLAGYELELTGGSDKTGTPMRKDVKGSAARRILLTAGTGFHAKKPGERRKKRIFGYKIGADIVQVNFKVTKPGAQPLNKLITPAEKEKVEGGEVEGSETPESGAPDNAQASYLDTGQALKPGKSSKLQETGAPKAESAKVGEPESAKQEPKATSQEPNADTPENLKIGKPENPESEGPKPEEKKE